MNDPPGKLHAWQGQSFTSAALLDAIKEQDAEAAAESTPSARKSAHCVPRFCELIADERYRQRFAASKTQLTRQELDRKETGKKRNVVVEIWEAWKDPNVTVTRWVTRRFESSVALRRNDNSSRSLSKVKGTRAFIFFL